MNLIAKSPVPSAMPVGTLSGDQVASTLYPKGRKYHVIWLEMGDNGVASNGLTLTSATDIATLLNNLCGEVRVKINDQVQRLHTAAELNYLNALNGTAYAVKTSGTAGNANCRVYVPIFFAEPWRNNNQSVAASAWNITGDIESFKVEVVFKSGIVSPVLTGWYEYSDLDSGARLSNLIIGKVLRKGLQASGTFNDYENLELKDFLQAMVFLPTVEGTPHYISSLRVSANNRQIHELLSVTENQAQLLSRSMNPDTAAVPRFEYVLDYSDPVLDWLNMNALNSFQVHVEYNASASGTLPLLMLKVGPPDGV